jgi:acyl-CoA thioesterase I
MAEPIRWNVSFAIASFLVLLVLAAPLHAAQAAMSDKEIVIVAYGDSLTAGFQLPPAAGFPAQLEKALRARGHNVRVVNAGVSGDTAAEGLARFDWSMPERADAVILELGANDALRGLPLAETQKALAAIMERLKARGCKVLVAGMQSPRNWGPAYANTFAAMYVDLAKEHDATLYPFFLDGVALNPAMTLPDGLHPNEQGVARIVEGILPSVEAVIAKVRQRAQ